MTFPRPSKAERHAELETRFTYHPPQPGQPEKYERIRHDALAFALVLDDLCPYSREYNMAMARLEEAVMWANAAIARRSEQEGAE